MHDGSNDFPYLLVDLTCGYLTSVYVPVLSGMMHALEYRLASPVLRAPPTFFLQGLGSGEPEEDAEDEENGVYWIFPALLTSPHSLSLFYPSVPLSTLTVLCPWCRGGHSLVCVAGDSGCGSNSYSSHLLHHQFHSLQCQISVS